MTYTAELAFAVEIVRRAAEPALALFERPDLPVFDKPDGSIVTQADYDVNDVIVEAIASAYPGDVILSEEGPDDPDRLSKSRCWIVDPIDGTSHFERGDRDWSIMLALAVDGRPGADLPRRPPPAMPDLRSGAMGATPTLELEDRTIELGPQPLDASALRVQHSYSAAAITDAAASDNVEFTVSYHGLMSMTVMLADGMHAFVAARTSGSEWDLAPHAAILESVGGLVTDFKGRPRTFNAPDPRPTPARSLWFEQPASNQSAMTSAQGSQPPRRYTPPNPRPGAASCA